MEKKTKRSPEDLAKIKNRLSRIEGQIRGIKNMLDEDAYCLDVINQVSAARSALDSLNREILAKHISTCLVRDIKNDDSSSLEEINTLIRQVLK